MFTFKHHIHILDMSKARRKGKSFSFVRLLLE